MAIPEPTLEELAAFAGEQLGLDIDRDRPEMNRLAAIGLTIRAWRNTSLEDLHAGSHRSGGFSDAQMMRFNIATFRVVLGHVGADGFDWSGLAGALSDPDRPLPGDLTVGELSGEEFGRLADDSLEALAISERTEERQGFRYLLTVFALQAGISYKGWYGSPWWRDVVERFIELVEDPSSSAWKHDHDRQTEPQGAADREALAETLLEAPESLDEEAIHWCLAHGLGRQASFGGFARWRRRRDPEWIDPSPWLSEA